MSPLADALLYLVTHHAARLAANDPNGLRYALTALHGVDDLKGEQRERVERALATYEQHDVAVATAHVQQLIANRLVKS